MVVSGPPLLRAEARSHLAPMSHAPPRRTRHAARGSSTQAAASFGAPW
jgi:hypothetical protein